jgi:hypothetical protein
MIQICAFKEKEKEGGEGRPQLDGLWKVPMFGGPWKVFVATLALGLQPRQRLTRVWAKKEAWESHLMLPGV